MTQNTKTPEPVEEKATITDFTVTLGFSSLMTALTVFVGCVVVAFMMGVIVGRDDDDQLTLAQVVAERERAKDAAKAAQQGETTPPELTSNATAGSKEALIPNMTVSDHAKIMSPEELKYATELKARSGNTAQKPSPAPAKPKPAPSVKEAQKPQTSPSAAQGSEQDKKTALYDYIYQVASLKDESAVDKLRAQLEGEGLRTRMSKVGAYLKVVVLMRGTEEQALALQDRMVELKLGKPLQQQKQAVE